MVWVCSKKRGRIDDQTNLEHRSNRKEAKSETTKKWKNQMKLDMRRMGVTEADAEAETGRNGSSYLARPHTTLGIDGHGSKYKNNST